MTETTNIRARLLVDNDAPQRRRRRQVALPQAAIARAVQLHNRPARRGISRSKGNIIRLFQGEPPVAKNPSPPSLSLREGLESCLDGVDAPKAPAVPSSRNHPPLKRPVWGFRRSKGAAHPDSRRVRFGRVQTRPMTPRLWALGPARRGHRQGTFAWALALYRRSQAWAALSPATQRQRDNIFKHIEAALATPSSRSEAGRHRGRQRQANGDAGSGRNVRQGAARFLRLGPGSRTSCRSN